VTFRLGGDLAVRLPRRAVAVPLLHNEQRWLPVLAEVVPLPVPAPVRTGGPGAGYPWPWSVVPWLEGATADAHEPAPAEVAVLGRFLRALHHPAPPDAPRNPVRGVPLEDRAEAFALRLAPVADAIDAEAVRAVFAEGAAAPPSTERVWLHGDLHPRNLLVRDGRLAAVLDWGDLCAGDPATDLMALWMLAEPAVHGAFWDVYGGPAPALVARARGWAALLGTVLLGVGLHDGDPAYAAVGRRTLEGLLAGQG
jgi:aminoglycoside phosphotransferase (APT) family kinase protein